MSVGGKGKMSLIAVTPAQIKADLYLMRYCLFDRSFSYFGFRGRLLYDVPDPGEMVQTIRSVPKPDPIPSTADLLMLAWTYRYLADGADYLKVRDKIKTSLPPLR